MKRAKVYARESLDRWLLLAVSLVVTVAIAAAAASFIQKAAGDLTGRLEAIQEATQ